MKLATLFTVLLLAWTARAASVSADDAYHQAKADYQKLKGDAKRRAMRHHWHNVAKKFESVAAKFPKSERAPEALFNAAELSNELSRFSGRGEDRDAAKRHYRKLVDDWPQHRLSDDAALALARILADFDGDTAGARRVLEGAVKKSGDKKGDITRLLAALPKPAQPVVAKAPPKVDAPTHKVTEVTEAIRRAISPLQQAAENEVVPASPSTHGRRLPPSRPEAHDEERDEVVEPADGAVASLAERLRDVRVGARGPDADDAAAKSRFKKMAQAQEATELSLAQQLGLKVKRVVIDAGHGGHDTGAIGPKGTREKDVALAIAKKLASQLEQLGLEVLLTRDDDTFVTLEDRTRFANRHKGDLFISVHCNAAANKTTRGIETYTLNTSSNRYSIRLAARENATTERGVGDLQYILADLATKANTGESAQLADRVQRELIRTLSQSYAGVKDLGTKEALFFVLLGAKMPSILVETSFLSHPEEEARLADDEYQQRVANAVAEAVDAFLEQRNKVAQMVK